MPRNRTVGALLSSPVRRDILRTLASLPAAPQDPTDAIRRVGLTAADIEHTVGIPISPRILRVTSGSELPVSPVSGQPRG